MALFGATSSVPLRRGSMQGAFKVGLMDIDKDTPDADELDVPFGKRPVSGEVAGILPEDIIREIATLLSTADILSFSLAVSTLSLAVSLPLIH